MSSLAIEPSAALAAEIRDLKQERGAYLVAHNYQRPQPLPAESLVRRE